MATQEKSLNDAITIAVSSQTLFNMKKKSQPLLPGVAFPFVKALINVNIRLRKLYPDSKELFDIVLMTNNQDSQDEHLINSIRHYGLTIEKLCMIGSDSIVGHLKFYKTDLYLSEDSEKVKEAIEEGIAAATMSACENESELDNELRVAFDGDGVLFSDESEIIFQTKGKEAFIENERALVNRPLEQGPLKGFLQALVKLQQKFHARKEKCPIRTYLVTSRDNESGKARVLTTFRSWNLKVDEEVYLTGTPKGPPLQKIRPHIFFDDKMSYIIEAQKWGTIAAHVPYGIGQKS
ncbi:cytosolic 5'-nucleotidase 1A-like [Alosa sapidissima]|uniref:cytosolic 5'-nucleotidase 1A-like n=1 Tax=Alosa sapidissima TaxID=34773 RepID=UPI001C093E05|nr:cytosolic 5'-nucleotidase 1A-like [Alosa sapidissima]